MNYTHLQTHTRARPDQMCVVSAFISVTSKQQQQETKIYSFVLDVDVDVVVAA